MSASLKPNPEVPPKAGRRRFTAEELDFIINDDIKYRMSDDLFEDDDE